MLLKDLGAGESLGDIGNTEEASMIKAFGERGRDKLIVQGLQDHSKGFQLFEK